MRFYDGPDLEPVVLAALRQAGLPSDVLDADDLAAMDEFHARGRAGTLALAELAGLAPAERLLDLGAGIGGPSRALTRHFGAEVTALDSTERFCRLARQLNALCGLADRIAVVHGDGTRLPFDDAAFDLVWTQAVWQSVRDKAAVAAEIRRVLRPGGRLALLEVVSADGQELHYPLPWADGPQDSFVVAEDALRATLVAAGLQIRDWRTGEQVQQAIAEAPGVERALTLGAPGLGLDLLLPDYSERMAALERNVADGRITLVLAVLTVRSSTSS